MSDTTKLLVGIDFGTFNIKSCTYNYKNNRMSIFDFTKNQQDSLLPNIVTIKKDGISIGKVKGDKKNPSKYTIVDNIKRHLEEEDWKVFVQPRNKTMNALEIASEEFDWIKNKIEDKMKIPISEAIITIPVCFSEIQKNRVIKCAKSVGLPIKEVIVEPLAGLFSYDDIFDIQDNENYNIFIFDFGGGTLDLSLVNISKDDTGIVTIEMLSSRGIRFGGQDITKLMYDNIIQKNHKKQLIEEVNCRMEHYFLNDENIPQTDKEKTSPIYKANYENLSNIVINDIIQDINTLKEDICETQEEMDFLPNHVISSAFNDVSITFNYDDVINLLEKCNIFDTISETIEELFDSAMKDVSDVNKILMIGGTSKIEYFKELLIQCFQIDENNIDDIFIENDNNEKFNAVAKGSTIYLKDKNINFKIINRLSYEVGIIENNQYVKFMDINTAYGNVPTMRKPIKLETLDNSNLKINMYQIFHDTTFKGVDIQNDAIYMGYFKLNNSKYSINQTYLVELFVDELGSLRGNFFDGTGTLIDNGLKITSED